MNNRALVFIKPHGVNNLMIEFIENFLKEREIRLTGPRIIKSDTIRRRGIIDDHYFAIAATAVFTSPDTYTLSDDPIRLFRETFDISWEEAREKKLLFNAVESQEKLGGISGMELNEIWKRSRQVKLAPGLYAGYLADHGFYCINGFYPGQREVFTAAGAMVAAYSAEFDPERVSWKQFRRDIIGATDPEKAAPGSLRNLILLEYEALGLSARPEMSRNGIHAGAGPLEGFRERKVWLREIEEEDPFASALLRHGMNSGRLHELLQNPQVTINGQTAPIFDLTEDMDADEAAGFILKL